MVIRAILEWDEETQSYSATFPQLNFVSSYGDSREEAANLKDEISLILQPPIFL